MENLNDKLMEWAALYGMKVVGALAILILGYLAAGIVTSIIRRVLRRGSVDETLTKFLATMTKVGLLVFVALAAMNTLGVQTTSFIAVIGAAGLAVGFALQGSLSNFAAGVMLIMFRPIKCGDYVEAGGAAGSVEEIHIFNTILKSPDNKKIIVPNSSVTGGNIINYSAHDTRRVDMVFGIGYSDDVKLARETLEDVLRNHPLVLRDPAWTIAVSELGDSAVNFVVRPWVKTADYWTVHFDVHEQVKACFDAKGISIPFPQRDIHIYQTQVS